MDNVAQAELAELTHRACEVPMSIIVPSNVTPLSAAPRVAPANSNIQAKVNSLALSSAQPARSVSSLGMGLAAGNAKMSINDAIDAYTKNPGNITGAVDLTGSATDFSENFAVLARIAGSGKLGSITLADGGPINIDRNAVTGAWDATNNQSNEVKVLQAVKSKLDITVKNATVNDAINLKGPKNFKLSYEVTDTADNIKNSLALLSKVQAKGGVSTLTVVDEKEAISLTAAEYTKNANLIKALGGSPSITITGVKAADATKMAAAARVTSVRVEDTGANIAKNVSALNTLQGASKLTEIVVFDGSLEITSAQATAATHFVKAKFNDGNNGTVDIAVTDVTIANIDTMKGSFSENETLVLTQRVKDTSQNISTALAKLEASVDQDLVDRIQVSGGAIAFEFADKTDFDAHSDSLNLMRGAYTLKVANLTASEALQFTAPNSNAKLSLSVIDTAANIASNIANLQKLVRADQIQSIKSSDMNAKTIELTAGQAITNAATLGKLSGTYKIYIKDAKAADGSRLQALMGGAANLEKMDFKDTGANIAANIVAINSLAAKLGSITVTDNTLNLSEAQAMAGKDNVLAAKFIAGSGNQPVSVNVNGVTVANAVTLSKKLADNTTITGRETIVDTATNLDANLNSLGDIKAGANNIASIKVSDGGVIEVADKADFDRNKEALALITTGIYTLKTTKASLADLTAYANVRSDVKLGFGIEDSAININQNLSSLKTLSDKGQLTSIAVAEGDKQNVILTADQMGTHKAVVDKLSGTFGIEINGASAAQAALWRTDANIKRLNIEDSAAGIESRIDGLKATANVDKLGTVKVTEGSLSVSASTLNVATAGTTKFFAAAFINGTTPGNKVDVNVSDVDVSDMETYRTLINSNLTLDIKQKITDLGADIAAKIDELQSAKDAGYITQVSVSDGGDIDIKNKPAYDRDSTLINTLQGRFTLKASQGVSIADANAMTVGGLGKVAYKIADTATNIETNFDSLAADFNNGKITSLISTDGTAKSFSISAAQVSSGWKLLESMAGAAGANFSVKVTGAVALDAKNLKDRIESLGAKANVSAVNVNDSANNVVANIGTLQALAADGQLGDVKVGATDMLTLTQTQVDNNGDFLGANFVAGATTNPVKVKLAGVAADKTDETYAAIAANGTLLVDSIYVSDTAANIATYIGDLEKGATNAAGTPILKGIDVNDNGDIELDNSGAVADIAEDNDDALALVTGAHRLKITNGISLADATDAVDAATSGRRFSFEIADDGSALVAADFTKLIDWASKGMISKITLTNDLQLDASQVVAGKNVLDLMDAGTSVKVVDIASNLLANATDLTAFKGTALTTSVTTSDTSFSLTVADAKKLDTLLDSGSQLADVGGLEINDFLANIAANSTDALVKTVATSFSTKDSGTITLTSVQEALLTTLETDNANYTKPAQYNLI